ncbi:DJ-1 family glyoxalase III [uncultured Adlercreutzia sp.]|uniref:DJ-1 family glyoxalase III n=1 Tax=uncultured Adlercreutzia sp. TaxID=875803 RepID=UPI00272E460D|nr:DJ-1 family glyoxalase III [uncultured Adlercreutzia sp.]
MKKTAAIMLGDGFEPVEVIGPVDVLRRGGVTVDMVSVMGRTTVTAAQDVTVEADKLVEDVDLATYDVVIVPGGSVGVENLAKCQALAEDLRKRMADDRPVASICAGPTILADLGLLEGREAVCYPGCQTNFPEGVYQAGSDIAVDGNLITATGPAVALVFGIAILNALMGDAVAAEVGKGMLLLK